MNNAIDEIINSIVTSAHHMECQYLSEGFNEQLNILYDENLSMHIKLLKGVVSFHLDNEDNKSPFKPCMVFGNRRSADITDLSDQDYESLKVLYGDISDCEIKARIADVLWVGMKLYQYALESIDQYLKSAKRIENWENWCGCYERIERAFKLGLSLGKSNQKLQDVIDYIEDLIFRINGSDSLYLTGKLISLLHSQKNGFDEKYITVIDKNIASSLGAKDYNKARYYLEIKGRCFNLQKKQKAFESVVVQIAVLFEKEAMDVHLDTEGAYMSVVYALENAIATYRTIPGKQGDILRLLKELEPNKMKLKDGLKCATFNIDIEEVIKSIDVSFATCSFLECIIRLAYIQGIQTKSQIKNQVERIHKSSFTHLICSTDIVDSKGKRVVKMPSLICNTNEEYDAAIEAYMLKEAASNHSFTGSVVIANALKRIKERFPEEELDTGLILDNNIFVPEDRKIIFEQGLQMGYKGNLIACIHILIPQLENSFREFASLCGDVVTTLEDDGKEQAKPLNSIFELINFVEAFDENLLFDLRSLLTEKYGSNMRNRLAHGLLSTDECESSIALYIWWLSLRLCCMYSKNINQYVNENIDIFEK